MSSPKLVVGIVVDQMRYDYIYRYWDKYAENGFKRLLKEGFFCKNTNFDYMPTYTGPGHASIYSGTTPSVHGIIANEWYDRSSGKPMYCSYDKNESTVGSQSRAGHMSPRNMLTTSITDALKIATNNKSKVIGIALKDRGAILPAGHMANAAYWYDASNGYWVSSTYYMKELPQWVNDFNKKEFVQQYLTQSWNTLLPISQYSESLADDNPYETSFDGQSRPVFPYDLATLAAKQGLGLIRTTPFGNSLTKEFAIATIKSENMGKSGSTDFIAISFSSPDYIGHKFGPQSVEMQDCYLRLDRDIAELLTFLDSWTGKASTLLFLTSDHGAVDVPSYLMDNNIPAGYIDEWLMKDTLKKFLFSEYSDSLVLDFTNQQLYLNRQVLQQKKIDEDMLLKKISLFLTGFDGISTAYWMENLPKAGNNTTLERYNNGYYFKRSGEIIVHYEPAWVSYKRTGTTHGSPYSYDTHVPLLWYGYRINAGSSAEPVSITDIAPTLSIMLNISYPNGCTGKPIPFLVK